MSKYTYFSDIFQNFFYKFALQILQKGTKPLNAAASTGNLQMIATLINFGASVNPTKVRNKMFMCCMYPVVTIYRLGGLHCMQLYAKTELQQ